MNRQDYYSIVKAGSTGVLMVLDSMSGAICQAIEIHRNSPEVEDFLADIANGRRAGAKVKGYTIFLIPHYSFGGTLSQDEWNEILRGAADYFLEEVIGMRPRKYRKSDETRIGEEDPEVGISAEQLERKRRSRQIAQLNKRADEYIDERYADMDGQSKAIIRKAYFEGGYWFREKFKKFMQEEDDE